MPRSGSARLVSAALWVLFFALTGCALLSPVPAPTTSKSNAMAGTTISGSPEGSVSVPHSASLAVYATTVNGRPLGGVLVYLQPLHAEAAVSDPPAVLDILDRHLEPVVLPVHSGGSVRIQNLDDVPHDIYSFSEARRLSLHLAAGAQAVVQFPRPGVVTMGSKIYNDMKGYLYVTEAPYFGKTDDHGFLRLSGLPPGPYTIGLWRAADEGDVEGFPRSLNLAPDSEQVIRVRW